MSPRLKLFVERSRDEKLLFTPFTSAPLGEHSAPLGEHSAGLGEHSAGLGEHSAGLGEHSAPLINCSSSEAETRNYYSHPSPRLRSVSTRLRSGCNHHALFVERSRGSISDLLSLIFRNLNSSKTYYTKNQ
jgi:hypothetical protein